MPGQLATLQQPDGHAELHSVDVIPLLQACFEAQPKPHSVVLLSGECVSLVCPAFRSGRPHQLLVWLLGVFWLLQSCLEAQPKPHSVVLLSGKLACQHGCSIAVCTWCVVRCGICCSTCLLGSF